eukprot:s2007_g7.t1
MQQMLVVKLLAVFCSAALEVVAKVLGEPVPASLKLEQMVFELLRSVLQDVSGPRSASAVGGGQAWQARRAVAYVELMVMSLVPLVSWIYYQLHLSRDPQRPPDLEKPTVECEPLRICRMLQVMELLAQQVRVQQVGLLPDASASKVAEDLLLSELVLPVPRVDVRPRQNVLVPELVIPPPQIQCQRRSPRR